MDTDKILKNCEKNLGEGRAVATGIEVFAHITIGGEILVRKRTEQGSITGQDLSGKWELIGGAVRLEDFDESYQSAIFKTLKRRLMEEAGLELVSLPDPILVLPAWHGKDGLIDMAFTVYISWEAVKETPKFDALLDEGKIRLVLASDIKNLKIISPRMEFMIKMAYI
jgi:8-oxo-dGTP pyrophosphatase MutT (NUDIX family)